MIHLLALFALSSATQDAGTAAQQHPAHRCRWNDQGVCRNTTQQVTKAGAPGVEVTVCNHNGVYYWHSQQDICTHFGQGCRYGDACRYKHLQAQGSYTDVSVRDYTTTLGAGTPTTPSQVTVTQSTDPTFINDWCRRYVIGAHGQPLVAAVGFDSEWTSQGIHGAPEFIGAVSPQYQQALLRQEGDTFKAISLIQLAADTQNHGTQVLLYPVARYCAGARFPEDFPRQLADVLASNQIAKVGIGCIDDAVAVLHACNIPVNGAIEALTETELLVNPNDPNSGKVSLANLCTAMCNFNDWKPKNKMIVRIARSHDFKFMKKPICPITCSDWCQRLTREQIDYAALDAVTGLRLYKTVQNLPATDTQARLTRARNLQTQQTNAPTPQGREIQNLFLQRRVEFFLYESDAALTDIVTENNEDLPDTFQRLTKPAKLAFHRWAVAQGYLA